MDETQRAFQVGDSVKTKEGNYGIVLDIGEEHLVYPVKVHFPSTNETLIYTTTGGFYQSCYNPKDITLTNEQIPGMWTYGKMKDGEYTRELVKEEAMSPSPTGESQGPSSVEDVKVGTCIAAMWTYSNLTDGNYSREQVKEEVGNPSSTENLLGEVDKVMEHESTEKAKRNNKGKINPTNIHPAMFMYLARVGHKGGGLYEKGNYLIGGKPSSEYLDSAFRHILKAMGGIKLDEQTGEHHAAHAAWNLLMYCWAIDSGLSKEDTLPTKDLDLFLKLFKLDE